MPHLVIEYSRELEEEMPPANMMRLAHQIALESGQFGEDDIKVRLLPYDHAMVGGREDNFLHVSLYLLSGRDTLTKKALTLALEQAYRGKLPDAASVSADARDMDRESYSKSLR